MNSSIVYDGIYNHFFNYEYKLFNSYLYDWESDFFAVSKSGYAVEVEVKVSRGDFFKDFEKPKHKLFNDWMNKKTHHITSGGYLWENEDRLICEFENRFIEFEYGHIKYKHHGRSGGWGSGMKNGKWGYWANDYGAAYLKKQWTKVYARATKIKITPIADILCPNSLYYACPVGLIKPEEIPKYAGLIYVNDTKQPDVIKKAPYIHKNQPDITRILLKKFYNLWQYQVSLKEKMKIFQNQQEK